MCNVLFLPPRKCKYKWQWPKAKYPAQYFLLLVYWREHWVLADRFSSIVSIHGFGN